MLFSRPLIWRIHLNIFFATAIAILYYGLANAATQDTKLLLRPHCITATDGSGSTLDEITKKYGYISLHDDNCADFFVEDPQTLRTAELRIGDEIDMDIVLQNPSLQSIQHARIWLSYDPTVLEGTDIEISPLFDTITPGESDFDATNGFVMIEISAEENMPNAETITLARIKFKVTSIPETGTPISFYDTQENGHTAVSILENGEQQYILAELPGGLHVAFVSEEDTNTSSSSGNNSLSEQSSSAFDNIFSSLSEESVSSSESSFYSENNNESSSEITQSSSAQSESESSDSNNLGTQRTAFSLLQIRNLRATTEGSSLYIGWDALNHPSIKAYNIYYGTTSGRYIQRKTVAETLNSLILRSLPIGTTYFIAVRAVADNDEESAFSQEVSVEIGDPSTASMPLIPGSTDIGPDGVNPIAGSVVNPTDVPGTTGTSSTVAIFLLIAAISGTAIAFRRQMTLAILPSLNDK